MSTAQPKRGGTFTLGRAASVTDFNPMRLALGQHQQTRSLFNTLARYDVDLTVQPELAEKWDFSSDGKSMTLKLRSGVKFHSGREFTSDDVRASVEFGSTDSASTMRGLYQTIKKVEMPDKYTAVLRFDSVNPGIFDLLDTLCIIDKETIADIAKTAIGTGPFVLDKYIPNDRIEMVPFKDYWDTGKPYLDRYVVRQLPDLAAMAINLEAGAVDCIFAPDYADYVRLTTQSGGKFVGDTGAPGAVYWDIAINCKAEPFTNKKVRQAIAWSIDRERFCKTILQGLVQPTCLMWPPQSWAYFKDMEGAIGFDLDKAKALLKEAGLEKGFETEILSGKGFGFTELSQILQSDLAKIGVQVKIAQVEGAVYTSRLNKNEFGLVSHNYGRLSRDPGSLVTAAVVWYTEAQKGNTRFESAEYDRLRTELQSTLDQEKRKAVCRKLQELALDECFVNPIAPGQRVWVYANKVKGFGYNIDNAPFVGNVWLQS